MNIGIDFGNTICRRDSANRFCVMNDNTLLVISELKKRFENVYIISEVNDQQKQETLEWMEENLFYLLVKPENIFFCKERIDKKEICQKLKIDLMIDDRPEVMSYLDDRICKIMIKSNKEDLVLYTLNNCICVDSWSQVYDIVLMMLN